MVNFDVFYLFSKNIINICYKNEYTIGKMKYILPLVYGFLVNFVCFCCI